MVSFDLGLSSGVSTLSVIPVYALRFSSRNSASAMAFWYQWIVPFSGLSTEPSILSRASRTSDALSFSSATIWCALIASSLCSRLRSVTVGIGSSWEREEARRVRRAVVSWGCGGSPQEVTAKPSFARRGRAGLGVPGLPRLRPRPARGRQGPWRWRDQQAALRPRAVQGPGRGPRT